MLHKSIRDTLGGDSLELLHTDQVVNSVDGHCLDQFVGPVHLTDRFRALFLLALGLLYSDNLAVLEGDLGLHVAAVRSLLVELLAELELKLHGLEGGRGIDGPLAPGLRDLRDGGGGGGGLPQQHVHLQSLKEFIVFFCRDPLKFPLEGVYDGKILEGEVVVVVVGIAVAE